MGDVAKDRRPVVLAGPPGAGRSSIRAVVLGAEDSSYPTLNTDDFKEALIDRAVRDGTLESFFMGPDRRALDASGERLFPMEPASLVHDESSMIERRMRKNALERGVDFGVVDPR